MGREFKNTTCCFTGHRIIPKGTLPGLLTELEQTLKYLIGRGVCYFCTGGALGFDTIAAEAVLRFRERAPQISLILVLPCREQTKKWSRADVGRDQSILQKADQVMYVSQHYSQDCMLLRNRSLVDRSSICVAYCIRSTGGSAYTLNYAQKQGLEIIRLNTSPIR